MHDRGYSRTRTARSSTQPAAVDGRRSYVIASRADGMAFDTSQQVYVADATGWQRGLYDDVQETFRAPVVNWIVRTLTANDPAFTRYLWAQLKPLFGTRLAGEACVAYREAVTEPFADDHPRYRAADLDLTPWAWRELRGQLETFDTVVPRLALLFETVYRSLYDAPVGTNPRTDAAATEPLPAWFDSDRGLEPTMAAFDEFDPEVTETVAAVQAFHGFEEGLPSIYRCLVQWPTAFTRLWDDLEPLVGSDAFDAACAAGREIAVGFVESTPYVPGLTPASLTAAGFGEEAIAAARSLFDEFARGPVETVLPTVPLIAASVGATA
jgi:hypothetical protein